MVTVVVGWRAAAGWAAAQCTFSCECRSTCLLRGAVPLLPLGRSVGQPLSLRWATPHPNQTFSGPRRGAAGAVDGAGEWMHLLLRQGEAQLTSKCQGNEALLEWP